MNIIEEKASIYAKSEYSLEEQSILHPISKETVCFESKIDFEAGYKEALDDIEIWMKQNQDDIDRKGCTMIEQYLKQFDL